MLGHAKSALKQSVQIAAGRARRSRRLVGFFRLPENFGLAHYHGIESGGDAKQMSHAIAGFVAIERFNVSVDFEPVHSGETACDLFGGNEILSRGVDFDPIAGA